MLDPDQTMLDELLTLNPDLLNADLEGGEMMEEEITDFDWFNPYAALERNDPVDFYSNLAERMSEPELQRLCGVLTEAVKEDDESRQDWVKNNARAVKFLGTSLEEDLTKPFLKAAGIFDVTLSNAVFQFFSNSKPELFPLSGPATSEVLGNSNQELDDKAQKMELYLNTYLTKIDKPYASDSDKLLINTGFFGCCFRKIFVDPNTGLPVARTVLATDLIVNNECSSLLEATRITHVFKLTKKELLNQMKAGFYRYVPLKKITDDTESDDNTSKDYIDAVVGFEGIKRNENKDIKLNKLYGIQEIQVELSASDFFSDIAQDENDFWDIPIPYVVSIVNGNTILSIKRNCEMNDQFDRIQCFVKYSYLPSFGLYDYGIAQLIGSNCITMTKVNRAILNAETLKIYPRGIRKKGVEFTKNNFNIGPNEFPEVDFTGPLQDNISFIQTPPQSPLLIDFLRDLREQTAKLGACGEIRIPESSYNAPVGTTLALLEQQNKATTAVLQGLHRSLSEELTMLYGLFCKVFTSPYEVKLPGIHIAISPEDFDPDINIVPVSNVEVSTFAHSLIKAESVMKMAQSSPDLHNMRNVFMEMYKAMKVPNIDEILLPPPPPPDPNAPKPIDPNEILMKDVDVKAENVRVKGEQDLLKAQLTLMKEQREYLTQWQRIILDYQKAGLPPPQLPHLDMPEIPPAFPPEDNQMPPEQEEPMMDEPPAEDGYNSSEGMNNMEDNAMMGYDGSEPVMDQNAGEGYE